MLKNKYLTRKKSHYHNVLNIVSYILFIFISDWQTNIGAKSHCILVSRISSLWYQIYPNSNFNHLHVKYLIFKDLVKQGLFLFEIITRHSFDTSKHILIQLANDLISFIKWMVEALNLHYCPTNFKTKRCEYIVKL